MARRDPQHVDAVEIVLVPIWHGRGIAAMRLHHPARELNDVVVFPSREDGLSGVGGAVDRLAEFPPVILPIADIDGHAEGDGAGLYGGERPDIGIGRAAVFFHDRRVGREDRIDVGEIAGENCWQREGAIQALTIELPETGGWLFAVAQQNDRLVRRGRTRRGRPKQRRDKQGAAESRPGKSPATPTQKPPQRQAA